MKGKFTMKTLLTLCILFAIGCVDQEQTELHAKDFINTLHAQELEQNSATPFNWEGWNSPCDRSDYGLVTCTNEVNGQVGYCVVYQNNNVCMPACFGNNYSCSADSHQEYNEGSECFCAPN